jgi:multidrug resistance efflux pump
VALIRANLEAATAAVQEAQWYAAALRGDPVPADASGAQLTALQAAKDAVEAAQDRLESTRIVSPVAGVVGLVDIHPGEYASPGQVVVIVSDLEHLQVETTDLSELDLPQLQIGDTAMVEIEALAEEATGHITAISPVADLLGGDVIYTVFVALDEVPAGLRPGMSAVVDFQPSGQP